MGEGNEHTPVVVVEDISFMEFEEVNPLDSNPLEIDENDDIYAPILKSAKWKKGGK